MEDLTAALADGYRAAALLGHDMVPIAEAFEEVRRSGPELMQALDGTERLLVAHQSRHVRSALAELRGRIGDSFYRRQRERLLEAMAADEEAGWRAFVETYVLAIADWYNPARHRLVKDDWPLGQKHTSELADIAAGERQNSAGDWVASLPLFESWARDESLDPVARACSFEYEAMIWLHLLLREQACRERLELAEALAPDFPRLHSGWAEYWQRMAELDPQSAEEARAKAQASARRALELDANQDRALIVLSELEEGQAADELLRQALATGSSDACFRMIARQLGESASGPDDPAVRLLIDLAFLLAPGRDARVNSQIGDAAYNAGMLEAAEDWYRRAIEADPDVAEPHISLGAVLWTTGRAPEAEAALERAVELSPGSYDAWSALAWVHQEAQEWDKAIEYLDEAMERRPVWEAAVRARKALALTGAERLAEAEEEIAAALGRDPTEESAYTAARELAREAHQRHNDDELALRVYGLIRRHRGEVGEAAYRGERGNVFFYRARWAEAIAEYELGLEADPGVATLWNNLSRAWEERAYAEEDCGRCLEEALSAVKRSIELSGDEATQERQAAASLERRLRILRSCGRAALVRPPAARAIEVEVSPSLLPYILSAGTETLDAGIVARVDEMRERIKDDSGVYVPGIQFTTRHDVVAHGALSVAIVGVRLQTHMVLMDGDVLRQLFEHLEDVVRTHVAELLGHEEAAAALDGLDDPGLRDAARASLSKIVVTARERAERSEPVRWEELARSVVAAEDGGDGRVAAARGRRSRPPVAFPDGDVLEIELAEAEGEPSHLDTVARMLGEELSEAVRSLALASEAVVRRVGGAGASAAAPWRFRVAGTEMYVPVAPSFVGDLTVVPRLAAALHRRRELWVTRAAVDRARELTRLDEDEAIEVVQTLARQGVSLERLAPADGDALLAAETAIASSPRRLLLETSAATAPQVQAEIDRVNEERRMPEQLADDLWSVSGIILPIPAVEQVEDLEPGVVRLRLNDVRLPPLTLPAPEEHVSFVPHGLELPRPALDPDVDEPRALVGTEELSSFSELSAMRMDDAEAVLSRHILLTSFSAPETFVDRHIAEHLVERAATQFPQLAAAIGDAFPPESLARALRALLQEGASMRDLRCTFDGLLEALVQGAETPTELARGPLRRLGCGVVVTSLSEGKLCVYDLADRASAGEPEWAAQIVADLDVDELRAVTVPRPIVVTPEESRELLANAVRVAFPPVLARSRDELPRHLEREYLGTLGKGPAIGVVAS
jgi:tetratricopeptide (TPR) repeat protein